MFDPPPKMPRSAAFRETHLQISPQGDLRAEISATLRLFVGEETLLLGSRSSPVTTFPHIGLEAHEAVFEE